MFVHYCRRSRSDIFPGALPTNSWPNFNQKMNQSLKNVDFWQLKITQRYWKTFYKKINLSMYLNKWRMVNLSKDEECHLLGPLTVYFLFVAFLIGDPFLYHWYCGRGLPIAPHSRWSKSPTSSLWAWGWISTLGLPSKARDTNPEQQAN